MKLFLISIFLFSFFAISAQNSQELLTKIDNLDDVVSVKTIKNNDFFKETLLLEVRQPIDHNDTLKGFFNQRVFVSVYDLSRPVVFVTEGYGANYAQNPRYINELSPILGANQIVVEHRYFNESTPDKSLFDWKYLTVDNSAADHHHVVEMLKPIFSGKWVSTGISKGGQTTLYHRTLYPNDVDVAIPYVAPINFSYEDGREAQFLREVATDLCRDKIRLYLIDLLDNRDVFQEMMIDFSAKNKLTYRINDSAVFDYSILEFPFAFFQWGQSCENIPNIDASNKDKFDFLIKVSSPEYFSIEGSKPTQSFFYQAATEVGYYTYDVAPYAGLLSISSADNYIYDIFFPENCPREYHYQKMIDVLGYLMKSGNNILYIYGEWDPWSASLITPTGNTNSLLLVKPKGSHATRINNLPNSMRERAFDSLSVWLQMEIPYQEK